MVLWEYLDWGLDLDCGWTKVLDIDYGFGIWAVWHIVGVCRKFTSGN